MEIKITIDQRPMDEQIELHRRRILESIKRDLLQKKTEIEIRHDAALEAMRRSTGDITRAAHRYRHEVACAQLGAIEAIIISVDDQMV